MSEEIDFNFRKAQLSDRYIPGEIKEIELMEKRDFREGSWQRTWDDIFTLTEGRIIVLKQELKDLEI